MSGTASGVGAGVVLGLAGVLLAQQLGLLELSVLPRALEFLVGGAVAGAIVFGLVGRAIGRARG